MRFPLKAFSDALHQSSSFAPFPSPSLCPATCRLLGFVSPLPIGEQDFVGPLRLPVSPTLVLGT